MKLYIIVRGNIAQSLESKVCSMIAKGYEPIGGISIYDGVMLQAMRLRVEVDAETWDARRNAFWAQVDFVSEPGT